MILPFVTSTLGNFVLSLYVLSICLVPTMSLDRDKLLSRLSEHKGHTQEECTDSISFLALQMEKDLELVRKITSAEVAPAVPLISAFQVAPNLYASASRRSKNRKGVSPFVTPLMSGSSKARYLTSWRRLASTMSWMSGSAQRHLLIMVRANYRLTGGEVCAC